MTATSASSTSPPANSSASSPSTPPGTTNPPGTHPAPQSTGPEPNVGSGLCRCLETSHGGPAGTLFQPHRMDETAGQGPDAAQAPCAGPSITPDLRAEGVASGH